MIVSQACNSCFRGNRCSNNASFIWWDAYLFISFQYFSAPSTKKCMVPTIPHSRSARVKSYHNASNRNLIHINHANRMKRTITSSLRQMNESIQIFIHPSNNPSTQRSIHQSSDPYIHNDLSIQKYVHLTIHLFSDHTMIQPMIYPTINH